MSSACRRSPASTGAGDKSSLNVVSVTSVRLSDREGSTNAGLSRPHATSSGTRPTTGPCRRSLVAEDRDIPKRADTNRPRKDWIEYESLKKWASEVARRTLDTLRFPAEFLLTPMLAGCGVG